MEVEMQYTPHASQKEDLEQWKALLEPSSVAVNMFPEPMDNGCDALIRITTKNN
jgi:hypothetical protein